MSLYTPQQLAEQAEIRIGRITTGEWCKERVVEILRDLDLQTLRAIHRTHFLFAGIFTAGRQIADWSWEEIKLREVRHAQSDERMQQNT